MIKLCVITGIFCVIQVSVIRGIAIAQVTPNIVLVMVVYTALFHEKASIWFGFITGMFIDLYSAVPGYNALMGTVIGYGVGKLSSKVYKEVIFIWFILLFVSGLLHDTVIFASLNDLSNYFFWRYIFLGALYTTIFGVIMFYILRALSFRKS